MAGSKAHLKAGFAALPRGPATLSDADLGRTLANRIQAGCHGWNRPGPNVMPAAVSRHPAGKTPKTVAKRGLTIAAIVLFTLPVLVGMAGILVPAAGYFPVLGKNTLSIAPATQFLATAGLAKAVLLSLTTGLLATFLSVAGSACASRT